MTLDDDALASLPAPESEALRDDLAIIRDWAAATCGTQPRITVDRQRFDAGQGHALVVVTVEKDPASVRRQLIPRLSHPDRLRVVPARAGDAELRRTLQWVLDEQMTHTSGSYVSSAGIDDRAGVVRVALNRPDPELAARLAAHESGLIRVDDAPVIPVHPEIPLPLRRDPIEE
jgi:hypothetical protein